MNILLVEDDASLGFLLEDHLDAQGYAVLRCEDGAAGQQAFQRGRFDLCVLDVMLPKVDGFQLAETIRRTDPHVPILFLTARDQKEDRIRGFRLGADDYVTKPFSIEELDLRIRAILRRTKDQPADATEYRFGQATFDYPNQVLRIADQRHQLTQREADLLRMLAQHPNQVVKREVILKALWQDEGYFVTRSMDVFISRLRKYLRPDPSLHIANVHGVGYKLEVASA
ncbi:DNA-binding response regulator, OmpR family, contains REC and winged-helix (wHTH) domain [Catalinimonas alkaloidigena]|uniref:DNA-binding response regulator, OmpR family, contains REC and winged-helix (WHTH) domain n=1 Tax=Catalinimonas alkaloidigena TaxID=1075417 RepID=A0A1G9BQ63_9BACT|nr:response regulator transcription factor [Catalinimonas alkaloidigena]SDK41622.1 DNA-binding response regulator, OmpR family, contains REC and winged-helix (wHTH) domain [Catalinimonas alkaloidigena]